MRMPWSAAANTVKPAEAHRTSWFHAVSWAMGIGFTGILIYSWAEKSWMVLACAVFVALAAALVGALGGFLFGIPKTMTAPPAPGAGAPTEYEGNTNLEQISDWLTKILVGAGLVELKSVPSALSAFGSAFKANDAMGKFGWVAAPSLAIVYSVCGFLLAYLWARIYMIAELEMRKERALSSGAGLTVVVGPQPIVVQPPPGK